MSALPAGLSLCMIVKNEERFLAAALASVAGIVDEICIADTGSSDATLEIARAHGAQIVRIPWDDDFSQARNAALALATRRWIVVLDADERLVPASRAALAAIGREATRGRGKWLLCRNLTGEQQGSGALTNALVRIFPNDERIRYRNAIHEFVTQDNGDAGLPADMTPIEIVHLGYASAIVRERKKAERNLRLSRAAAARDPHDGFHQYNLGMASLLAGDRDGALLALDRMRELTRAAPRGYRAHGLVVLAELYAGRGDDLTTALDVVDECLAHVPNYADAHFAHGKILARRGEFFAARNAFGRAIESGAHDREHFVVDTEIAAWKAHAEIGTTLMRERRFAEALAWFELAAAGRPAVCALTINQAKCCEALGDTGRARALFAGAFAAAGDEASAIEWIDFLLRCGASEEAFDAVESALRVVDAPTRALLLATVAAQFARSGSSERARYAIDRALATGDPVAARATIEATAQHFGLPELAAMARPGGAVRAAGVHIAYVS